MNKVRIKDVAISVRRGLSPSYSDDGLKILNQSCIRGDVIKFSKCKSFDNPSDRGLIKKGDSLINSTGTGTLGRVSIYDKSEHGYIDSHITKVSPDQKVINPDYLHLFLMQDEINRYFNVMSEGATNQIELSRSTVNLLSFNLPPLDCQKDISVKVKSKLSIITSCVESLKQKLLHLEEYKTALIHNAVTKGLDANGCRILDGTPEADIKWRNHVDIDGNAVVDNTRVQNNWQDIKLKYIFNRKEKKQNMELGCGSISFGVVILKDSDRLPIETKMAYQEVLEGEFLINPLNLNFDLKSLRTAKSELNVIVSSGYIVLQGSEQYDSEFLQWLLRVFDVIKMKTLGGGVRQTVTFNDIGKCWISVPDRIEQEAISRYVKKTNQSILELKEAINKKIALLVEYKKSLINEAVSGNI